MLIDKDEGPLFFGFARGFINIAARAVGSRLLVLRMDRVSLMDQSGAYALQDALVDLKSAGARVLVVGLPQAQLDILEAIGVVPNLLPRHDLYANFGALKKALPKVLGQIGALRRRTAPPLKPIASSQN
jgi:sulfate permease, SulP family